MALVLRPDPLPEPTDTLAACFYKYAEGRYIQPRTTSGALTYRLEGQYHQYTLTTVLSL